MELRCPDEMAAYMWVYVHCVLYICVFVSQGHSASQWKRKIAAILYNPWHTTAADLYVCECECAMG